MSRDNIVPVRLNDEEKYVLGVMAYREGLTVSSWIRQIIHREARIWDTRTWGIEIELEKEEGE